MPLFTLYQNLVISHGRSDINMWLNVGQIVLQLVVVLLTYSHGITAMVVAYSAFNILWLAAWQPFAKRLIGLRLLDVLRDVAPFMVVAAVVMVVTRYATLAVGSLWLLLVVRVVVAALLYYAVMRLLHVAILNECLQFIRKK